MNKPIQQGAPTGHHGPLSPSDAGADGPPTAHHASRTTSRHARPAPPRGWAARLVAMLALQAVFGGCLAAFGSRALDLGMPYAAALAAMAITVNAILVGLLAGPAGANPGGLLLLVSGVEVAGALACLGAARAADSSVWLLLTLGCTLVNMELVRAAAAMRLR